MRQKKYNHDLMSPSLMRWGHLSLSLNDGALSLIECLCVNKKEERPVYDVPLFVYSSVFVKLASVMSFIFVVKGFAEPCCKGRRLFGSIKVGNIPKGVHAEVCPALASFLCCKSSN